jgi:hypothetical protein
MKYIRLFEQDFLLQMVVDLLLFENKYANVDLVVLMSRMFEVLLLLNYNQNNHE